MPKTIKKIMASLLGFVGFILTNERSATLAGIWSDQDQFLAAIKTLKEKNYSHFSAITPYPVHGLEEKMNIRRSWIPWVTFIFGLSGCLFGLWFTWWTSAVNWPLIIGGKPFWSLPAFIPVIFECTILLGALSSVAALLLACKLPDINPPTIHKDLSSHKFAILFYLNKEKKSSIELEETLKKTGAEQVIHTDF